MDYLDVIGCSFVQVVQAASFWVMDWRIVAVIGHNFRYFEQDLFGVVRSLMRWSERDLVCEWCVRRVVGC
jgi:hypothetical protein